MSQEGVELGLKLRSLAPVVLFTFYGHLKIILEGHKNNKVYSHYLWGEGLVMEGD